ncbi:cytochrome c oxidase subunit 6B2 isoform X1 [Paramormyrops kingsleyae]
MPCAARRFLSKDAVLFAALKRLSNKMSDMMEAKMQNYRTAPFDARFPNTNQTRNCYQNYLDYHRCNKALSAQGLDVTPCDWYQKVFKSLCPVAWVEKWNDQVENGSFAGKI